MTSIEKDPKQYTEAKDFLENAEDCTTADEVWSELDQESQLLDQAELRRQRDWSALAHQVVGGENLDRE